MNPFDLNGPLAGALCAVLAALSFALWNIYLQRGMARGGTPRLSLLALSGAVAGSFLPVALALAGRRALPPLHPAGVGWFLGAGLLTAAVGPWFAAHATQRIGASRTTALRLLDPFFAYAIATLFLGERLSARATAGVALIGLALALLQLDRREGTAAGPGHLAGTAFAALASLWFTIGSVARKLGLEQVPSPFVAGTLEGLAGLGVVVAWAATTGAWGELRQGFRRQHADLWWSGLAAAFGTLFLNLALQRVPVPVAVALRNTAPWFALLLVPLLLGRQHRPGRWVWASTALLTLGMLLILVR